MSQLNELLESNKEWAAKIKLEDPQFFEQLGKQQKPEYLWIGCADSRVPATEIVDMMPGEIFVHRNIANMVIHTDLNCLSVIQYAVEVLKVKHIIVCGHYGCGGVNAAMETCSHGLIDNWLRHIKDVYRIHQDKIDALESQEEKSNMMCELNVSEQVSNITQTTIVQSAWAAKQDLSVHGWIYDIHDGVIKDLDITQDGA